MDKNDAYWAVLLGMLAGAFLIAGVFVFRGALPALSRSGWDLAVEIVCFVCFLAFGSGSLRTVYLGKTVEMKVYEEKEKKKKRINIKV